MIVVRCFDSLAQAAWLRDAVDALNLRSERPDPFSSFGFFETYARHDESCPPGRGTALWFLAAFRDDALVGVLPLRRVSRRVLGMPVATVGFLVTHDTDRPHVLACPQDLREVSEAFYAHLLARRREYAEMASEIPETCNI